LTEKASLNSSALSRRLNPFVVWLARWVSPAF
jgi:hypothetical protein